MPAARFRNDPEPVARIERVRSLLKALGAARLGEGITGVVATAEAPTSGNRRIDVLIEWQASSAQRHAAAIEAKLGHHVTTQVGTFSGCSMPVCPYFADRSTTYWGSSEMMPLYV